MLHYFRSFFALLRFLFSFIMTFESGSVLLSEKFSVVNVKCLSAVCSILTGGTQLSCPVCRHVEFKLPKSPWAFCFIIKFLMP